MAKRRLWQRWYDEPFDRVVQIPDTGTQLYYSNRYKKPVGIESDGRSSVSNIRLSSDKMTIGVPTENMFPTDYSVNGIYSLMPWPLNSSIEHKPHEIAKHNSYYGWFRETSKDASLEHIRYKGAVSNIGLEKTPVPLPYGITFPAYRSQSSDMWLMRPAFLIPPVGQSKYAVSSNFNLSKGSSKGYLATNITTHDQYIDQCIWWWPTSALDEDDYFLAPMAGITWARYKRGDGYYNSILSKNFSVNADYLHSEEKLSQAIEAIKMLSNGIGIVDYPTKDISNMENAILEYRETDHAQVRELTYVDEPYDDLSEEFISDESGLSVDTIYQLYSNSTAKAMNQLRLTNTDFDIFIGELYEGKEIFSDVQSYLQDVKKQLRHYNKYGDMVADGILLSQFAIIPTISGSLTALHDLLTLAKTGNNLPWSVNSTVSSSESFNYGSGCNISVYVSLILGQNKFPELLRELEKKDLLFSKLNLLEFLMSMSDEQLFQWITGANLDLGTVWNFIPFSFLIDEFTNIGSVFTRLETSKTIRMTKYDHTIYTYKKTIPVTTKSGGISSLELVWYDRKVMRHAYYAYTHIINWGIPIINSIGMKITTSALLWRDR